MRSKKVDEMINSVIRDLDFYSTERIYVDRIILQNIVGYIKHLEKITTEVDNQFIHKDKIYELTEELNKHVDSYNNVIDKFNKLLGE